MKILVLGKGVANNGVVSLLEKDGLEYEYLNKEEVSHFDYELVVKAPGILYHDPLIQKFLDKNIKVITDIELAFMLRKKFYIGVTGSNGKTTTVSLITHLLNQKYKAISCGNIGYSVCQALVDNEDVDYFVVELSSFQLEYASIDLDISVLLNINPCHLDHHKSFQDYILSKGNITLNQSSNHYVIYNESDKFIQGIVKKSNAIKRGFSIKSPLPKCSLIQGFLYLDNKKYIKIPKEFLDKEFLTLDIMAALAAVSLLKLKKRDIIKGIHSFKEIEYRLTKKAPFIYNDAKSTNPYSTIAALKCFKEVALLCGGYERNENLACLKEELDKIKVVYAYGNAKDKIKSFMEAHHKPCFIFQTLEEAFKESLKNREDEVILFSPMFASFDQFHNYIERGKYFDTLFDKYYVSPQ